MSNTETEEVIYDESNYNYGAILSYCVRDLIKAYDYAKRYQHIDYAKDIKYFHNFNVFKECLSNAPLERKYFWDFVKDNPYMLSACELFIKYNVMSCGAFKINGFWNSLCDSVFLSKRNILRLYCLPKDYSGYEERFGVYGATDYLLQLNRLYVPVFSAEFTPESMEKFINDKLLWRYVFSNDRYQRKVPKVFWELEKSEEVTDKDYTKTFYFYRNPHPKK